MDRESETIASTMKLINNLMKEFDSACTKPNLLLITAPLLDSIKEHFPYLIKDGVFVYNNVRLSIVVTETDVVGLAFSFYLEGLTNEIS